MPTAALSSYFSFIWKEKINRKYLIVALALCIAQFVIFKLCYPFPDFFDDSYSYIFAASEHLNINIWPIGYSKLLAFFHSITYSDTAFVAFQYFFMQCAALHFYYTILYFFKKTSWTRNALFIFMFLNPLTLYLCNLINSDALFGALSLLWLTELIWIIKRPASYQLMSQALLLFLCFTVRNNAYYYPVVTAFAFLFSRQATWRKISGITLPLILIIAFVNQTQNAAEKITGNRQYSLFTGWQLANNALYIYDKIDVDSNDLSTQTEKELNKRMVQFLRHVDPAKYHEYLNSFVGNFFIKSSKAPLKEYFYSHYHSNTAIGLIRNWGQASAVFEPFGKQIILQHPIAYSQFFVWPNVWRYFIPPLSHLELYNYGTSEIDEIAKTWFHYPTNKIHCISYDLQGFLIIYEGLFLFLNLCCIYLAIKYLFRSFSSETNDITQPHLYLLGVFLLLNFIFSISATANILRYQFVTFPILLSLTLLLSDLLLKKAVKDLPAASTEKISQVLTQVSKLRTKITP